MNFSNYIVLDKIGDGGMATVYKAQDKKFDTPVAIKVLNKDLQFIENIRKRFIAEARNLFKMNHPNIIKVIDLIDDGDLVAFVMEYIEGETLKDHIERKGKLSDDEIKSLFSQMLDAVGYVHEQNLVHRDIKPSNFMLDKKGRIKLMDFGIAKMTDTSSAEYTQTGTGVQMGTPMYMSPEQVTETRSVTAQSDIYSLGVVLWQMITGQKPYDIKTLSNFQLQTKIVNEPLDNTNSHWDDLIQKATIKDIASRILSANAFKIILESKNDKKVIESDSTIIDTEIKQAPKPEPSSSFEAKVNNENAQVREEVHLQVPKKNYLPVILIVAFFLTALVVYLVNGTGSSSNYAEAEKAKADSIAAAKTADSLAFAAVQVKIGEQVWMTENLNVDRFLNGDPIPEAKTDQEWLRAGENQQPAWCYYENNPTNGAKYGKLYNWYAVNDQRGLAPKGWHVPSDEEWSTLTDYLGGEDVAGTKLKSTSDWAKNGNGTNKSGFSGLPGGERKEDGLFHSIGKYGSWWTSTETELNYVGWIRLLGYSGPFGRVGFYSKPGSIGKTSGYRGDGYSVRCLRD